MKKFQGIFILLSLLGLFFIGCADNPQAPSEYNGKTVQKSSVSLEKKGPIANYVHGSCLFNLNDKNAGGRVTAFKYFDGTYGGDYEINAANANDDKTMKWNGKVLFLKVYENIGENNGKMAVIGGIEKTGPYAGWYEVWFVIDNGKVGQNSVSDQHSIYVGVSYDPYDLAQAEYMWNLAPSDLIAWLGVAPADRGNVTVN